MAATLHSETKIKDLKTWFELLWFCFYLSQHLFSMECPKFLKTIFKMPKFWCGTEREKRFHIAFKSAQSQCNRNSVVMTQPTSIVFIEIIWELYKQNTFVRTKTMIFDYLSQRISNSIFCWVFELFIFSCYFYTQYSTR